MELEQTKADYSGLKFFSLLTVGAFLLGHLLNFTAGLLMDGGFMTEKSVTHDSFLYYSFSIWNIGMKALGVWALVSISMDYYKDLCGIKD